MEPTEQYKDRSYICGPASITFFSYGVELEEDTYPEVVKFTDNWNGVRKVTLSQYVEKRSKSGKTTYKESVTMKTGIWIPNQAALQKEAAEIEEMKKNPKAICDEGGRYETFHIKMSELAGIRWGEEDEVVEASVGDRMILTIGDKKYDMRSSCGDEELENDDNDDCGDELAIDAECEDD